MPDFVSNPQSPVWRLSWQSLRNHRLHMHCVQVMLMHASLLLMLLPLAIVLSL